MGTIWLAEAPDGALVVVKTLSGEIRSAAGAVARDAEGELWIDEQAAPGSGSPGGDPLQRLERETRITRSLDHHHIVRCPLITYSPPPPTPATQHQLAPSNSTNSL